MYADLKSTIFNAFPISHDATIIVIGLCLWLIAGLVFRLPMGRFLAVVPLVIVAVAIELSDVVFLDQAPVTAVRDFILFCLPVAVLVFFQSQGWARR